MGQYKKESLSTNGNSHKETIVQNVVCRPCLNKQPTPSNDAIPDATFLLTFIPLNYNNATLNYDVTNDVHNLHYIKSKQLYTN